MPLSFNVSTAAAKSSTIAKGTLNIEPIVERITLGLYMSALSLLIIFLQSLPIESGKTPDSMTAAFQIISRVELP